MATDLQGPISDDGKRIKELYGSKMQSVGSVGMGKCALLDKQQDTMGISELDDCQ